MGASKQNTYLGFRTNTVLTINPNVFCHGGALLVEIHVLHELTVTSAMEHELKGQNSVQLTFAVYETVVDSA